MTPNHKGEIPLVLLFIPFVGGLITGLTFFPQISLKFLIIALGVSSVLFISLNIKYQAFKIYKERWLGGVLAVCILFLLGWIFTIGRNELRDKNHFSKIPARYLLTQINSEPVEKNGLFRFTANVLAAADSSHKKPVSGTLLISIKDTLAAKLKYGDELVIPAKYNLVAPPLNPAEFNYKAYLANKNIYYQAFLYPGKYVLVNRNTGNRLISAAIQLKHDLAAKLRQNIRDTNAYAVTSAMLLSYRTDLNEDLLETYAKTGAIYVLTVSGAQVGIIWLVLSFVLGFLDGHKQGRIIKAAIIIAVIWYYSTLTGFTVPVCRAALVLSLVIIGKIWRRYINTLNILAVSAFILLCYNPYYIAEAGFQLSYLAVFGVLILRPLVYRWFLVRNKIFEKLWSLCSWSVAIQLAISPLCMFYFHQFPVYFLFSNLFVIIPAAIILYSGSLFLLLPKIPLVSAALAFITEKTAFFMNNVLIFVEHIPGSVINRIWISGADCFILYIIITCLYIFWFKREVVWLRLALAACLLFVADTSFKNIRLQNSGGISWLSLGKHQGIVFRNGHAATVFTDLAETDKTYRYSVQPYLDSCGVTDIKVLKLSDDVNTRWLKKRLGFIQFRGTKVFILEGMLTTNVSAEKINTDLIYLTGNPDINPATLVSDFSFKTLIVDGSNSDRFINQLTQSIDLKGHNIVLLKRNKSFATISN